MQQTNATPIIYWHWPQALLYTHTVNLDIHCMFPGIMTSNYKICTYAEEPRYVTFMVLHH